MISKEDVIQFAEKHLASTLHIQPSFFELTMMMAFNYFAENQVDVAVIEVGLGGRLTVQISLLLIYVSLPISAMTMCKCSGDTLPKIAREKAGIIKSGIPVVIGEAQGEVKQVFIDRAKEIKSPHYIRRGTNSFPIDPTE